MRVSTIDPFELPKDTLSKQNTKSGPIDARVRDGYEIWHVWPFG